ncbi:MAG TPA: pentapeptide repeat-containing protein [Schlesneria sp.]|jgi:uncharacterized protein YjbI with pentapeptide repeats
MPPPASFSELIDRYQLGERDFQECSLDEDPDNDLRGACLDGIDLSHSYIVADFRGASLCGARFCQANVKTCDFRDANLSNASFAGAALCATTSLGATLDGAGFAGASNHSYVIQPGEYPDW